MSLYLPEGFLIKTEENKKALSSFENFKEAFKKGTPLEARALTCDKEHNLHIDFGFIEGIIPRSECAVGIDEGECAVVVVDIDTLAGGHNGECNGHGGVGVGIGDVDNAVTLANGAYGHNAADSTGGAAGGLEVDNTDVLAIDVVHLKGSKHGCAASGAYGAYGYQSG